MAGVAVQGLRRVAGHGLAEGTGCCKGWPSLGAAQPNSDAGLLSSTVKWAQSDCLSSASGAPYAESPEGLLLWVSSGSATLVVGLVGPLTGAEKWDLGVLGQVGR